MRRFLIPVLAALVALAPARPAAAAGFMPAAAADDKGKKKGEDEKGKGQKGEHKGEHKDAEKGKKGEDGGEKLPATAAAAVRGIFPGMKVVKVEKEDEDGDVVYEVTLRGKNGTLEAKLTPKGRVVEVELKGDKEDDKGEKEKGKKGEGDKGKKSKGEGDKGKKSKGDRD